MKNKFAVPFDDTMFIDWCVPLSYADGIFYMQATILGDWEPLLDESLEEWRINADRFNLEDGKNHPSFQKFFRKLLDFIKTGGFHPSFHYTYYTHISHVWSDYAIDLTGFVTGEADGIVIYETSDWTKVCLVYKIRQQQFHKMWQDYLVQNVDGDEVRGTLNWYGRYESDPPFHMPPQEFKEQTEALSEGERFVGKYVWLQGKECTVVHDDYWYWPISKIKEMVR